MTIKIQMVSAHMVRPINRDWNHSPNSGPKSISMSLGSKSAIAEEMSMEASAPMTPEAWATMPWARSNTPITIFQVLVTMRMAQAVLNIHLKNTAVSISWKLFLSVMI